MNLEQVRREMRERQGELKGWVLTFTTIDGLIGELGLKGGTLRPSSFGAILAGAAPINYTLFGFPVVVIADGQPEGVIV